MAHTEYDLVRLSDQQVVKTVRSLPTRIYIEGELRADFSEAGQTYEDKYELRAREVPDPVPLTLEQEKAALSAFVINHTQINWITTKAAAQTAITSATTSQELQAVRERIDWDNLR